MKITKYILSMAAAAGMLAACQEPEMVQMVSPEDVVAPVLHELDGPIVITPDNKDDSVAVFSWEPADFGVTTQIDYVLELSKVDGSAKKTLASGVTKTEATVSYLDLNGIIYADFELEAGIPHELLLTVGASVGVTETFWSEPMTITASATAAEKVYPKLSVAGSYNGWVHNTQYLFDFEGNDNTYQAVIDFGEDHAANEFKITGGAWGDDEHSMNGAHDPESKTISLVAGGGDNINVYQAKRYYHLTFTRTPDLTADFSFDQIGVIGDFNNWGGDVVMQFNPANQKFYADVEFPADGGFKFRADGGWDVNWGSTGSGVLDSGDNIPVKAGNYRVYLNMNDKNKMTYELNAAAYGTEEDTTMGGGTTEPEDPEVPETLVGWGLVGAFSGWADGADVMLASDGTYLVAKGVELEGELKFRKDGAWGTNLGLAEGDSFAANTELALVQDGANLVVTAGTYDVYLEEATGKAWFINDGSYPGGGAAPEASEWGIVGVVNGWGFPDVTMYKTSTDGLFVAYNVAMPDGGFKIRKSAAGEWNDDANYGLQTAGAVEVDHWYSVITSGGSGDMSLTAGNYDIWFDLNNTKVYIMTPGKAISEAQEGTAGSGSTGGDTETTWYIVGNFNGWTVGDTNYQMTKEGDWYVFKNFTADGQGVKFNAGNWDVNRGGDWTSVGGEIAVTNGGNDIYVPAGTYDVYMNAAADKVYFMTVGETPAVSLTGTWYLVGDFNGWTPADANYQMTVEGNWYVFKNFTADGQGVKLVADSNWSANRGGTFTAANEAISVVHNGDNMTVTAGTYDVYLNAAEDTVYFMTPGSTPSN